MMRKRVIAALVLAGILAFAMRDVIESMVIQPLIYLWWAIGIYYHTLPQVLFWIVLVVVVIMMAWSSLVADIPMGRPHRDAHRPPQGAVEALAGWMRRAPSGQYFKWLMAQRLAKLARELIAFNARQAPRSGREALNGPGWDPPDEVAAYLESGLNGSFADYPRPRGPFRASEPTPLDLDPNVALDYIETQVEKS